MTYNRQIIIQTDDPCNPFQDEIPMDVLLAAGHYFKGMLGSHSSFREAHDTLAPILINHPHPQITADDWEVYFDLARLLLDVDNDGSSSIMKTIAKKIEELPLNRQLGLMLISQFLCQDELLDLWITQLKRKISSQPLDEYLIHWPDYLSIFESLDFGTSVQSLIFQHLNSRLESFDWTSTKQLSSLLECFKQMYRDYVDQPEFLVHFYQAWWPRLGDKLLDLLAKDATRTDQLVELSQQLDRMLIDPIKALAVEGYPHLSDVSSEASSDLIIDDQPSRPPVFVPIGSGGGSGGGRDRRFSISLDDSLSSSSSSSSSFSSSSSSKSSQLNEFPSEDWDDRWRDYTYGLLEGIKWTDWPNLVVAGGSVARVVDQEDHYPENSDVDIFILGTEEEQRETLTLLISWYLLKYTDRLYLGVRGGSVVYLWFRGIRRYLQIICPNAHNLFELLARFDLTHSQVAYHGAQLRATPLYLKAIQSRTTQIVNGSTNVLRLNKAHTSGFQVQLATDSSRAKAMFQCLHDPEQQLANQGRYRQWQLGYYFPTGSCSPDKNKYELNLHHKLQQVYHGPEIRVTQLPDQLTFCNRFTRGYEKGNDEHSSRRRVPVDLTQGLNWSLLRMSNFRKQAHGSSLAYICYHGAEYDQRVFQLPPMPYLFGLEHCNHPMPPNLCLQVSEEHLVSLFEQLNGHLMYSFVDKLPSIMDDRIRKRYQRCPDLLTDRLVPLLKWQRDRDTGESRRDLPASIKIKLSPSEAVKSSTSDNERAIAWEKQVEALGLDQLKKGDLVSVQVTIYAFSVNGGNMNGLSFRLVKAEIHPGKEDLMNIMA